MADLGHAGHESSTCSNSSSNTQNNQTNSKTKKTIKSKKKLTNPKTKKTIKSIKKLTKQQKAEAENYLFNTWWRGTSQEKQWILLVLIINRAQRNTKECTDGTLEPRRNSRFLRQFQQQLQL